MGGTSTSCASVVATQYLLREWNRSLVRGAFGTLLGPEGPGRSEGDVV